MSPQNRSFVHGIASRLLRRTLPSAERHSDARLEAKSSLLQRSPALRAVLYLAGAIVTVQGGVPLLERLSITHPAAVQWGLLAIGTPWTYLFLRLEQRPLSQRALKVRIGEMRKGAALGALAFLAVAGAAATQGWLKIAGAGWQNTDITTLLRSVTLITLTHTAIAWNEELVFRGYGYDVVRSAAGPVVAASVMTALFAVYHPWQTQALFGEAALGAALLALRLRSGDLWLPIGYHWAWNLMQTAVLGPADGPLSLLPTQATGPYEWVGRPGYPEPGLLMAMTNLLVALVVTGLWKPKHTQDMAGSDRT